jgi:hypothetical protein
LVGCCHGGGEVVIPFPTTLVRLRVRRWEIVEGKGGRMTYLFIIAQIIVARPIKNGTTTNTLRLNGSLTSLAIARGT